MGIGLRTELRSSRLAAVSSSSKGEFSESAFVEVEVEATSSRNRGRLLEVPDPVVVVLVERGRRGKEELEELSKKLTECFTSCWPPADMDMAASGSSTASRLRKSIRIYKKEEGWAREDDGER